MKKKGLFKYVNKGYKNLYEGVVSGKIEIGEILVEFSDLLDNPNFNDISGVGVARSKLDQLFRSLEDIADVLPESLANDVLRYKTTYETLLREYADRLKNQSRKKNYRGKGSLNTLVVLENLSDM